MPLAAGGNTRLVFPFWDDCDKGTAHESASFGDLGDAGRRLARGGVRKPLRRLPALAF
jgi:hypothetical protein